MDNAIQAVWAGFNAAYREYCSRFGVRTVAFWRLGLAENHLHDPEQLRQNIARAILTEEFDESHIPAFLLCVQTQAAGHSHWLWEDTVIPLLAGSGSASGSSRILLRQRFSSEHPFRSALRSWLKRHSRAGQYTTVLSGTSFMLCRQAEQPFRSGLNFCLGDPRA